ncbi:MAG: bactofilin family protein [Myxococcota bacterium]
MNTLVGRGSHFEGKMTFEGVVRIDGSFVGEIVSDDTLIIGEGAEVRAELDVASVVIYGAVYGNIRATQCVELHTPGHLVGNIISPSLVVDKGAIFDGNCRMGAIDWTEEGAEPEAAGADWVEGSARWVPEPEAEPAPTERPVAQPRPEVVEADQ